MKSARVVLAAVIFTASLAVLQSSNASESDPLFQSFQSPANAYRGKPFWSWNGKLDKEELLRQMRVIQQMGFGGFFMHSRTGLATEYLGDEWFNLVNVCADEAEKLGLEAWLYDEDRWPSGSAGGKVTRDPQYRTRYLRLTVVPGGQFTWSDDILAAFAASVDGINFHDAVRIVKETDPKQFADRSVLKFTVQLMQPNSFYNGATYLDTMNPKATARFIEVTHDQYAQRCGARLGKSIKGIFTDEPHRGMIMSTFGAAGDNPEWLVPWSDGLPATYQKRFGADLIDQLPELFLRKDGEAVSPVKWQYVETAQQMFLDNFVRPINDWCEQHHVILTGHVLHEDTLACQVVPNGSMMRNYEYMGYPGIDLLTEGNRNYWVAKQLDSAAHQFGRKWRMSELYGVTGWQFNFESHKNVGDWQALFGINLRCPHLSWYTMKGEAKRDYPASILHQSAWWPYYNFVETYFARLGLLMQAGEPATDVLVVNPVESLWAQIRPGWCNGLSSADPRLQQLEKAYQQLFQWLTGHQIDFDYGDEDHIARHGQVAKANDGKPRLQIGQAKYRTVIVPQMDTIRSTTLEKLEQFLAAGGSVIVTQSPPQYVDAKRNERASKMAGAKLVPFEAAALLKAVSAAVPAVIEVVDADNRPVEDVLARVWQQGDKTIVVALNSNRARPRPGATIRFAGAGAVEKWSCVSGARERIPSSQSKPGILEVKYDFPAGGELALVTAKASGSETAARPAAKYVDESIKGPLEFELAEPNVCVLDRVRFRVDDVAWQSDREILKADQAIRDLLKLPRRGGEMLQPWFVAQQKPTPKARVTLDYDFQIGTMPKNDIELALETPELFDVKVNGTALDKQQTNGWWVDPCFVRVKLPLAMLRTGDNSIEVSGQFHEAVDLEAMYLLGAFGVKIDGTKRRLEKLPDRLDIGTVANQGLPFYGGEITYRLPVPKAPAAGQKVRLSLPAFEAACVIAGDFSAEHMIAWPPMEADVTDLVKQGGVLPLKVVLTRRNTFGPLHLVPMRSDAYGPGHWVTEGGAWTDSYQLWPAGLLESPRLGYESR